MYSPNLYLCVATVRRVYMLTSSQFLSDDLIAYHEFLEPLFFSPSPCNSKISCFLDGRLMSVNIRLIKGRFAIFHFNLLKTERQ